MVTSAYNLTFILQLSIDHLILIKRLTFVTYSILVYSIDVYMEVTLSHTHMLLVSDTEA